MVVLDNFFFYVGMGLVEVFAKFVFTFAWLEMLDCVVCVVDEMCEDVAVEGISMFEICFGL